MSHPQPPQRQPTPPEIEKYTRTLHNVALGALIACPILALLPPRKLDFFTWGLIGTTGYSANYLTRERSGRSIWQYVSGVQPHHMQTIPAHEQATLHRDLQQSKQELQRPRPEVVSVSDQLQTTQSQREVWKAQREREIQDDLDVGKGFGDMIADQIWEVWNWGKKSEEEEE
ncbi:hypothetical protein LTR62_000087 [Meristemomyces frigidus]|uniref:Uncharacterized protein n=1 Tax=Meristemomyces frigidus TaxID=1508187 RepID=A0AAN7TQ87_9PEZI|nr:hypothetical protein LTR62_000087 [Meristemomyces frigidus]